ncbi:hypothetical protein [Sphaerimonospora mesophila]
MRRLNRHSEVACGGFLPAYPSRPWTPQRYDEVNPFPLRVDPA